MVVLSLGKSFISLFTLITLAIAVNPAPAEKAKWDAVCASKAGPQFTMTFDANGQPTGTCTAPPVWKCYWGPYKDAKTGADGCCGKDNGAYVTDPKYPQEGGCCVSPNGYSFDNASNRGGCCPNGQAWSFDAPSGKGGCCASGHRWMVDATTAKEGCCPAGNKIFTNNLTSQTSCCNIPDVLSVETSTTLGGCCASGLQFMTDRPTGAQACCKSGEVISVDRASGKNGCCDAGKIFTVDAATGQGGCCAAGTTWSIHAASGKGGCCAAGQGFNIDPVTGNGGCCAPGSDYSCNCACKPNPSPTCPNAQGLEFTAPNGKRYRLYCNLINHGTNDLDINPATDWAACIDRCAARSDCVRAIYEPNSKTCYLRSHGNNAVPITPDPYWSAHLIDTPVVPPVIVPPVIPVIPKECPIIDGQRVTIGGIEYELFCQKSFADTIPVWDATDATDIAQCMAQCSADPGCQGVNFFDDGNPQNCVMASRHEFQPTGDPLPDKYVTAIPVTKR